MEKNEDLFILDQKIKPGESKTIHFSFAKLYTSTKVEIPIIVERAIEPGPVILMTAGIHGDEINGVEVVRQVIAKKINKPKRGTIICVPILNIFGFLNASREFPDGRDLNRVFPGSKTGSLASRVAYHFTKKILPLADLCLDFHTGGSSRFNAAQIRITKEDDNLAALAETFGAPFIVHSPNIDKTYRATCKKLNIPILLFEGGKSLESNKHIVKTGVDGVMRILSEKNMLADEFSAPSKPESIILIESSKWIRAQKSGLLHVKIDCNKHVEKGEFLATITDPYGTMRFKVLAPNEGYIINVNHAPIVYQGDAIFHISTKDSIYNNGQTSA
ncbi:succinylglutamate desuccinylase/aspartoacylase family protein [Patiriisocius hiemis]|uniref:Succinylglutamate desuccinylase/aspartoacylase family protein n=1 Tax=Patiriisocius hiemis TaxID=3075604 RepID=A0ABU2YB95_9FLAO|nr:succinylglutamate desuccinylase/aspartoacylase family protein [Constantimarinum sp. W242]MDT0555456.1 succinylglutamate desuccinylase/aspartoacylase family protein [Constantimarinum sp. W242]